MSGTLTGRDLLTLADLTPAELVSVLDTATEQKAAWVSGEREAPLAGRAVALIFQKPSMRTRISFEVACARLGVHPVTLAGSDSAFSRGESVFDTVKVMERYVDAIVVRTFEQSLVEEMAEHAAVPVINALTDDFHPCQGLADLLTMREHKGALEDLVVAYVGDGNNMAHTYMLDGALTGMDLRVCTPEGFAPKEEVVEHAHGIAVSTGATITLLTDPEEAVRGADVVATDTWASMGHEAEHDERLRAFEGFTVDADLMALAAEDAIFMHCLPAHRGEEVTDQVIDSVRSVVFDEAENRMHVQKALLSMLLDDGYTGPGEAVK